MTWDARHFYRICFDLYVDFFLLIVYFKANVFGSGSFGETCVFCSGSLLLSGVVNLRRVDRANDEKV